MFFFLSQSVSKLEELSVVIRWKCLSIAYLQLMILKKLLVCVCVCVCVCLCVTNKNNLLVYFFANYIGRPCKWDYQIEHSLQPQAKNRLSCQFWWLHQTWMSQGYWKGETGPSLLCQFCCCCFWLLFVCCCCCCFGGQGEKGGRVYLLFKCHFVAW